MDKHGAAILPHFVCKHRLDVVYLHFYQWSLYFAQSLDLLTINQNATERHNHTHLVTHPSAQTHSHTREHTFQPTSQLREKEDDNNSVTHVNRKKCQRYLLSD